MILYIHSSWADTHTPTDMKVTMYRTMWLILKCKHIIILLLRMSVHHTLSIKLTGKDGDLLLDYSKNIITEDTLKLLFDLVGEYVRTCTY